MKITIVGAGYVGFSLGVLLSMSADVCLLDNNEDRVRIICEGGSPIRDAQIEEMLKCGPLPIEATLDPERAYPGADWVVLAVPTDYDERRSRLKTTVVEQVLEQIAALNPNAAVVIKSTLPVGVTRDLNARFPNPILFSPEFLRENHSLQDNREPDRIIVGYPPDEPQLRETAANFASLLQHAADRKDAPCLIVTSDEAEAIKLLTNTYLAMRVAFFNELDSFAEEKALDPAALIAGLSYDHRIGDYYNNPSFGFGGYCLPKDSRQMASQLEGLPCSLIPSIPEANERRIHAIADQILKKKPRCVGIYRFSAKSGSDNCRSSSSERVAELLADRGVEVLVYEPLLKDREYSGFHVCPELSVFLERADLILANRYHRDLDPVRSKVYTRDLYSRD